ncbi:DMT family transporter [Streptomyces sp. TS71-3]|uniref:DMT family transporter n=1 Tax=Streptomyces sp. TS71-3 TaxID=2733862 RepID=UPI001BB43F79|nr:DMT family transporter [Streptomyces sp. TS71-3]
MSASIALLTSLLWGLADFGGGLLTRRIPALTVVVVSQSCAVVVLATLVAVTGGWPEAGPRLWFAVGAGLVGTVAMFSFYRALALGPMGVVSPLGSLSVAVPVGVGLVLGERPGILQAAGIAVAVIGVILAGGPELRGEPVQRRTVALTLVAAAGFGTVMALISHASTNTTGLFLALLVQRVTNVLVGGSALLVSIRRGKAALPQDGGIRVITGTLPALAFVGLADVAANGTYAVASRQGPVAVAAVLASLYPVVTALAARGFLSERLRGIQAAGAGLAILGAVLLATG